MLDVCQLLTACQTLADRTV